MPCSWPGLLHRAQWHHSPAGIAAAALKKDKKHIAHLPESPHQLAWLRTWMDLRAGQCPTMKELIEFYLSSLSGTGTIDRWFGALRRLEKYRPNLDPRGAEAALKLTVQDHGGRRRTPLRAKEMLVLPCAKRTASGGVVAYPATDFALRCGRMYSEFFSARKASCRRMNPVTALETAEARLKAEKPRLSCKRKAHETSERAQLAAYDEDISKIAKRLSGGQVAAAEGPLGTTNRRGELPPDKFAAIAQAVGETILAGKSSSPASSSSCLGHGADDVSSPIRKQRMIHEKKKAVFCDAKPGLPVPYVDANGGVFRAKPQKSPALAPDLPADPTVLRAAGARCRGHMPDAREDRRPDIVLVASLTADFETPEALLARLVGSRLMDDAKSVIHFKPWSIAKARILHLSPEFVSSHPKHVKAIERACCWASRERPGKCLNMVKVL